MSRRGVASVLAATLLAAFVGGGVASAGDADRQAALLQRATSAEEQSQQHQDDLRRAEAREGKLKGDLRSRDSKIVVLEGRVKKFDERQGELDTRQAELDARSAELDKRQADLDGRWAGLDQREQALRGAEELERRSSIPGDGTFMVGSEVTPGRYRSPGPTGSMCYVARLADLDADFDSIITNHIADSPVVIDVAASDEAVETSGCQLFEKIG